MVKKVAIVTFRFFNFGTILQSLGLQEALHNIGLNDVELLDFPNEGGQSGKTALIEVLKEQVRTYGLFKGIYHTIIQIIFSLRARINMRKDHTKEWSKRADCYKSFENRYLHLSKPMRCEDLRNESFVCSLPYDCYIAGSDQIWNEKYTSCLDVFFLKYMPIDSLRMSYAGSFGRTYIEEEKKPMFAKLINNLNPILVREQGAKIIADEISGRESYVVLDPTLLHDRIFWEKYEEKPKNFGDSEYILVYSLNLDLKIYKEAIRLGKKTKKRVVAIKRHFCPPYYNVIEWLYELGPQHFLWLVKHANMVITNSFHAEVFSLIFNTPCYPFLDRAEQVNERLTSLLNIVGHDSVITYIGQGHITPHDKDFDFSTINERLENKRLETYELLSSILLANDNSL